jgi:LysR family glycine cleavage system transcriptional activator
MNNIHRSGQPNLPLRAIPPLTALLAFERAATQLSFPRAARDLALSPSAISQQIRGLEECSASSCSFAERARCG